MRIFTLAAFIIFTAFCTIVAVSNRTVVNVSLHPLPFAWDMPLYLMLFLGIFIGLMAGAIVMMGKSFTHAQLKRRQNKQIRDLEKQISELTSTEETPVAQAAQDHSPK